MASLPDFLLRLLSRLFPRLMNRVKIDVIVSREKGRRPHPYSLWTGSAVGPPRDKVPPYCPTLPAGPAFEPSSYVSWPGLFDRSYTGRHLPPADRLPVDLPTPEEVVSTIFLRSGPMRPCKKTSALFCFFAQWFTDSFLRTHPCDRRRHTGNNEIDLCQIYGLDELTTRTLRTGEGGLLKRRSSQWGDLLPLLVVGDDPGSPLDPDDIRPEFAGLSYMAVDQATATPPPLGSFFRARLEQSFPPAVTDPARWRAMYATGLDRGNSTIFYTALSTMCLREHNRVARDLAQRFPQWDDDRLFETARLINIHNVLEIVVEDYINHIAGGQTFKLDANFAERRPWYRTNRISLEFNLLYRWHSLVPDEVQIGSEALTQQGYRFNNAHLERLSPETLINEASARPAGRIGLYNTPAFLERAEASSIALAREFRLRSFNDYCERFGRPRYGSIKELVGGDDRAERDLGRLYKGDVDKVEFVVGLFAEGRSRDDPDAALPPLLRTMVAVDAFTHILTNPVLSEQVRHAAFAGELADYIRDTGGVGGLMKRNFRPGTEVKASFQVR